MQPDFSGRNLYDDGEIENYEAPAPENYFDGERYERICEVILTFFRDHESKLADQVELMLQEYTRSEAARELGIAVSTAGSRMEQIRKLCRELLDSTIVF